MPSRKKRPARRRASARHKRKPYTNPGTPWTYQAGVTQSLLNQFLECPEQCYRNYGEGWTSKKLKYGQEFGSVWHLCQEHQFDKRGESPASVAHRICRAYGKLRRPNLFRAQLEMFEELLGLVETMFPLYCNHWKVDDREIEWIEREQKFATNYTFTDHRGKSRDIILRGMRDGVFREDKLLGIFETKTKSQVNTSSILHQLRSDMQTMFYAVTALLDTGEMPSKILYNVVRRPMTKRKQGESLAEYFKRVQTDIKRREHFYFMRWNVDLNGGDIDNYINHTLNPVLRIFTQWADSLKKTKSRWGSPYHYLNCNALVGKYGKCDLWDLLVPKKSAGYYKRTSCFPELDDCTLATRKSA